MIVVSNASPLITLSKLGRLEMLPKLFGAVVVPPDVLHEVAPPGSVRPGSEIRDAEWISVKSCVNRATYLEWRKTFALGAGETATVLLALELSAELALIDDRSARHLAIRSGVRVMGTIGILEAAFRKNLVPDLRAAYEQLIENGAFIERSILSRSLKALGLPDL